MKRSDIVNFHHVSVRFNNFPIYNNPNGITFESACFTFVSLVTGEDMVQKFGLLFLRLILHPPGKEEILFEISVSFVT